MPLTFLFGPAVSDVVLSFVLATCLAHCLQHKQWGWLQVRWVQLAFALTAYSVLRSLWVEHPLSALPQALAWFRLPLFAAALAYMVLPHKPTEHRLLRTTLAAVAFLAADTLWQFYSGTDFFGRPTFMSEGYARLTGPFTTPHVGITLVWLLFPALAYTLDRAAPRFRCQRAVGMALLLGAGFAIYFSGERMAMILLLLGTALSVVLMPRARSFIVVIVLVACLAGWQLTQHAPAVVERQVGATTRTVGSYWDTVYGRTWLSAAALIHDYPVFGVGIKQFHANCINPAYGPNGDAPHELRCPLHPHNMYLAWFAEGGLVGGGLMLAIIGCWGAIALREWRRWWKAPVATGLLIALALRLFPISVTPNHLATWVVIPLWFYAGWLLALLQPSAEEQKAAQPVIRPALPFDEA